MPRYLSALLLFPLFLMYSSMSIAGNKDSTDATIYMGLGYCKGTHNGIQLTANTIFAGNNILALTVTFTFAKGLYVPSDYNSSSILGWNLYPKERLAMVGVMYGKMLRLHKYVRFSLKGGPAYGRISNPVDFRRYNHKLFEPNYAYNRSVTNVLGLVLNPAIELPLLKEVGISIGCYSLLNTKSSSIGIEIAIMQGNLR